MIQIQENPLASKCPEVAHSNLFGIGKRRENRAQNAATMAAALQQGIQLHMEQIKQQEQSQTPPETEVKPKPETTSTTDTDKNKEVNETGDDKIMGMPKAAFFSILSLVVIGLGTGAFFLFRGKKQVPVVVANVKSF